MRVASHASLIRRPRAEDTPSGSDEDSHHDSQMGEGLVHEDSEDDAEMYDYTTQNEVGDALDACAKGPRGASVWSTRYPEACNPYLEIRDFGVLGLPVSCAEAQRLCWHSEQAGFATNTGGSFLVPADCLAFRNDRAWKIWLNQVVALASEQLGVPAQLTHHELAHLSVSRGEEVVNNMPTSYATLTIVLPSLHAGGHIGLKLGSPERAPESKSDTYTDASIPLHTVAQAWYHDASLDKRPVTEGVRFALTYHLVFTDASRTKPSAPIRDTLLSGLERALRNWKLLDDGKQGCPASLAYPLSQQLSSSEVTSFDRLVGVASTVTHCLREIANRVGFRVALGHFVHTKQGEVYDHYGHYGDFTDAEEACLDEVKETRNSLRLFSGDGVPLGQGNDKFDLRQLLLDDGYFDKRQPDRCKWEEIDNPCEGTALCHYYDRLVVVIWPISRHATILASVGGQDAALNGLMVSTATKPSNGDLNNVAVVLAKPFPVALPVLTDLAVRWNDRELWHNVLNAASAATALDVVGLQRISAAIEIFGWPRLQSSVKDIVGSTASTGARLSFIVYSQHQSTKDDILNPQRSREYMAEVISSILNPAVGDIEAIVWAMMRSADTIGFLQLTILPQLASLSLRPDWWATFVRRLQAETGPTKLASDWQPPVFEVYRKPLLESIQAINSNHERWRFLVETCQLWKDYPPSHTAFSEIRQWIVAHFLPPVVEDVAIMPDIIKQTPDFLETTLLPLVSRSNFDQRFWTAFLRRLCQLDGNLSVDLPDNWEISIGKVLTKMLATHTERLQTNSLVLNLLDDLLSIIRPNVQLTAIIGASKRDALHALKPGFIESDLPSILAAAAEDPELSMPLIIAQLRAMSLPLSFWSRAVRETQARMTGASQSLGLAVARELLSVQAEKTIKNIMSQQQVDVRPAAIAKARAALVTELAQLIETCISVAAPDTYKFIFQKIFAFCNTPDKVHQIVVPLALKLAKALKKLQRPQNSHPIAAFFRESIRRYLTEVVTYRLEPESLAAWSHQFQPPCACTTCQAIASLIRTSGAQPKVVWSGAGPLRNHVHSTWTHLRVPGLSCAGVKVSGSPPAVQFFKLVGDHDPLIPLSGKDRLKQIVILMNAVQPPTIWQQVYADTPAVLQAVRDCLAGSVVRPHLLGMAEAFDLPSPLATTPVEPAAMPSASLKRKREDETVACGSAPTRARIE